MYYHSFALAEETAADVRWFFKGVIPLTKSSKRTKHPEKKKGR